MSLLEKQKEQRAKIVQPKTTEKISNDPPNYAGGLKITIQNKPRLIEVKSDAMNNQSTPIVKEPIEKKLFVKSTAAAAVPISTSTAVSTITSTTTQSDQLLSESHTVQSKNNNNNNNGLLQKTNSQPTATAKSNVFRVHPIPIDLLNKSTEEKERLLKEAEQEYNTHR